MRIFPFFALPLVLTMTGCASMMMKSDPEHTLNAPGEIINEHSIRPDDNIFTVMPVIPWFGNMTMGRTTGMMGASTGISVFNSQLRFGSLNAEGLYHINFNASDNFYKDDLMYPAPYGTIPKLSAKITYDIPLLKLAVKVKTKPVVLGTFMDNGQSYYLYLNRDIRYERRFGLRAGMNSQYISTMMHNTLSTAPIQHPDHTVFYQRANSVKMGLVYTRTANTTFTALIDDPRLKERYDARITGRDEFFFDIDVYVSGDVLPVITGDSVNADGWMVSAKNPEDGLMKLKRIGMEAGYNKLIFSTAHVAFRGGASFGTGTGYIPSDAGAFFFKVRFQVGFGAIRTRTQ